MPREQMFGKVSVTFKLIFLYANGFLKQAKMNLRDLAFYFDPSLSHTFHPKT